LPVNLAEHYHREQTNWVVFLEIAIETLTKAAKKSISYLLIS
jgi:hypothetical protein